MEDKKLYTIETRFGIVTGTKDQLQDLSYTANAQACHYLQLMKEYPDEEIWRRVWLDYSEASSDIWNKIKEVAK